MIIHLAGLFRTVEDASSLFADDWQTNQHAPIAKSQNIQGLATSLGRDSPPPQSHQTLLARLSDLRCSSVSKVIRSKVRKDLSGGDRSIAQVLPQQSLNTFYHC
ncbi:hypothetical protein BSZ32_07025 [Rubritalea profundi]|uniref:Uncharacterized protein n=1 Tax=Rubritalea profundi TaxID=1658618 RepID=A0A2S7U1L6_9BACT|nr:hypothetical protein BSZ32_07025 [Rubritalea profundi]